MHRLIINPNYKNDIKFNNFGHFLNNVSLPNSFCYILKMSYLSETIMTMDEIDLRLKELAETIKQINSNTPKQKRQKRKAIGDLWELLVNNKRFHFCRIGLQNKQGQQLGKSFDECFNDSLAKVALEITEKIDNYDSQSGSVWNWFRFLLEKRFIDYKNDYLKINKHMVKGEKIIIVNQSLYTQVTTHKGDRQDNLTYLDLLFTEDQKKPLSVQLIEIIQQDKGYIFSGHHIEDKPHANYKDIAIKRVQGKSWKEIGQEMNISVGAITPFFTRSHKFFKPIISEYLFGEVRVSKATQDVVIADINNKMKKTIPGSKGTNILTFQELMLLKLEQKSWENILKKINNAVTYKELVYFYLKTINKLSIFDKEFNF